VQNFSFVSSVLQKKINFNNFQPIIKITKNYRKEVSALPTCHEMKKGEIYVCEECGLAFQVIKECKDVGVPVAECGCHESAENACTFSCCGKEMVKK